MKQTPENRSLPLWQWPTFDRERWTQAIQGRDIFDLRSNALSELAPATIEGSRMGMAIG